MDLQGKVAIVTGGATGIGRAIVAQFVKDGARVAIDYVGKSAPADDLARALEMIGGDVKAIPADVSDPAQVDMLVEETVKAFGRLDILVNNAGIEKETPFLEIPKSSWDEIIAVNLTGPFVCSQRAANQMAAQGQGGRIINISSVHEDLPMPTNAPYCAAKGGLRMLMRTMAIELAKHKITVNNIGPGAVDTPMDAATKADPAKFNALLAEIPLGRMAQPSEVAELCAFLASAKAAYITGSSYFIDGGLMHNSGSL